MSCFFDFQKKKRIFVKPPFFQTRFVRWLLVMSFASDSGNMEVVSIWTVFRRTVFRNVFDVTCTLIGLFHDVVTLVLLEQVFESPSFLGDA